MEDKRKNKEIIRPDLIQIPTLLLADKKLRDTDRIIYGYIWWITGMQKQKCVASNRYLAELCNCSISAIMNGLTRLEQGGYMKRIFADDKRKLRKQIIPLIKLVKVSTNEDTLLTNEDRGVLTNEEQSINSNLNINSRYLAKQSFAGKEINEIIYLFKEVNPSIGKYYNNISQRNAVIRMLEIYGREKLEGIIKALPRINAKQYWPKSTTPCQLEDNIAIYKAKNEEEKSKVASKIAFH